MFTSTNTYSPFPISTNTEHDHEHSELGGYPQSTHNNLTLPCPRDISRTIAQNNRNRYGLEACCKAEKRCGIKWPTGLWGSSSATWPEMATLVATAADYTVAFLRIG